MKRNKKGFTIVELVIVIAVIAILAAVLIPTFSNLIAKANVSADQQAVRSMNVALMSDEALNGKPSNLGEARAVLAKAGYNSDGYHPISDGHTFYWDADLNCILLVKDEGKVVIYPEDFANAGDDFLDNDTRRFNLETGWTAGDDEIVSQAKSASGLTVGSGEGETTFEDVIRIGAFSGETFENAVITLAEDVTLSSIDYPIKEFRGTLDGNGYTISGLSITPVHGLNGNGYLYSNLYDSKVGIQKSKYGVGLIDYLGTGGVVKNLTVEYADTDDSAVDPKNEYTYFGGIVGFLDGGTIENCTVSGKIVQYNRVGGIVGTALSGTIKNCTMTADITSKAVSEGYNKVNATYGTLYNYSYAGGIVAYVGNVAKATADRLNITGCKVENATLKSSGWAAGGIFGWLAEGTDITIADCALNQVSIDSLNCYIGLIGGYVRGQTVTVTNFTMTGTNSVTQKGTAFSTGDVVENGVLLVNKIVTGDNTKGSVIYNGTVYEVVK